MIQYTGCKALVFFTITAGWTLLALFFLGCKPSSNNTGGEIVHPTPENIPDVSEVDHIIRKDGEPPQDAGLIYWANRLSHTKELFTIGASEGEPHEMLGGIRAVTVDSNGTIYLLDAKSVQIYVYNEEGQFLQTIGGGYGQGPDEFEFPVALKRYKQDLLIVAAHGNLIKTFVAAGDTWTVQRSFSTPYDIEEVCALGDHIFVYVPWKHAFIHQYTFDGEPVKTFGDLYKSPNARARNSMSGGHFACIESDQILVGAFTFLPVVYAYSMEGCLIWKSMVEDFQPLRVIERGTRMSYLFKLSEHDKIVTVASFQDRYVLIQVSHSFPYDLESEMRPGELHTYLLLAETGASIYVGDTVPGFYEVANNRLFVSGRTVRSRFPQLKVLEF